MGTVALCLDVSKRDLRDPAGAKRTRGISRLPRRAMAKPSGRHEQTGRTSATGVPGVDVF